MINFEGANPLRQEGNSEKTILDPNAVSARIDGRPALCQ